MGKIPRKKHRGVKDPYKQQEVRLNKLKNKINQKPRSSDAQEIPRNLQAIAKFNAKKTGLSKDIQTTDKVNSHKRKEGPGKVVIKKKKKKRKDLIDGTKFMERERKERGMTRPTKMIPVMKQLPHENDKRFMRRVNNMTQTMLREAKFEEKFRVEVMRDTSGQVLSVDHREKIDAELLRDPQEPQDRSRTEKRRQARRERDQRRKRKNKKKEEEEDHDDDEFSYYKDEVKFGEVVYEPPSLDTKKLTRKVNGGVTKPKSFLFMEKLKAKSSETSTEAKKSVEVSVGRQRILEAERLRAVEAYRQMKAEKTHAVPPSTLS